MGENPFEKVRKERGEKARREKSGTFEHDARRRELNGFRSARDQSEGLKRLIESKARARTDQQTKHPEDQSREATQRTENFKKESTLWQMVDQSANRFVAKQFEKTASDNKEAKSLLNRVEQSAEKFSRQQREKHLNRELLETEKQSTPRKTDHRKNSGDQLNEEPDRSRKNHDKEIKERDLVNPQSNVQRKQFELQKETTVENQEKRVRSEDRVQRLIPIDTSLLETKGNIAESLTVRFLRQEFQARGTELSNVMALDVLAKLESSSKKWTTQQSPDDIRAELLARAERGEKNIPYTASKDSIESALLAHAEIVAETRARLSGLFGVEEFGQALGEFAEGFLESLEEDWKDGQLREQTLAAIRGIGDAFKAVPENALETIKMPLKLMVDLCGTLENEGLEGLKRKLKEIPEEGAEFFRGLASMWETFKDATPRDQSYMIGRLVGEIEILLLTQKVGGRTVAPAQAITAPVVAEAIVVAEQGTAALAPTIAIDAAKLGSEAAQLGRYVIRVTQTAGELKRADDASTDPKLEINEERARQSNGASAPEVKVGQIDNAQSGPRLVSDNLNLDPSTAGTNGIKEIRGHRFPDGSKEITIAGEMKSPLNRANGDAPNFNKWIAPLDLPGYEASHLWGPGFGDEAFEGIMYAPKEVNQIFQNRGIEARLRELHHLAQQQGATIEVIARAKSHPLKTMRGHYLLEEASYHFEVRHASGKRTVISEVDITVPKPGSLGKVTVEVTPGSAGIWSLQ